MNVIRPDRNLLVPLVGEQRGTRNELPVAGFTSDVTGLSVDFTDTSTDEDGTIISWHWDFGDGNTSNLQNPSHTYAAGNTFTVTLLVTDNDGDSDEHEAEVTTLDVSVDGPGDVYAPASAANWTALGLTAPLHQWNCQEASGNLVASIGTDPLVKNGNDTNRVYAQAVAGWTRTFVGWDAVASAQKGWLSTTTDYTPAVNESYCWLIYASFSTLPAAGTNGLFWAGGSGFALRGGGTIGAGKIGHAVNATAGAGTSALYDDLTTVRPFLFGRNCATSTAVCFTNLETFTTTYSGVVAPSHSKGIFPGNGSNIPNCRFGLVAHWKGANAEAVLAKATLTGLGWGPLPY